MKNQYVYGAINRLEQAVNGSGAKANYLYNGLGHRVGKQEADNLEPMKRISYLIDLTKEYQNLLEKTEDSSTQTYLWDGNVALYEENGRRNYYLQDDLGSPIRIEGEDGIQQETYGYGAFGEDLYDIQGGIQSFGYTGYQRDSVAGTYYAQAREYNARAGRFVGQDVIAGVIEKPFSMNRYTYCFNMPMVLVDLNGAWPKWIETMAKVVTVGVAVVAVGAVVVGTGGVAATVFAGVAVGGVVGGFANEKAGGSYINGWTGGAVAGGIQAGGGYALGPVGTIIGGSFNGIGSAITDRLDNIDKYNNKYKTSEQIEQDSVRMAKKGILCSIPGGFMQWATDCADILDSVAQALMGYTPAFGRGLNQFYGIIDNLLLIEEGDVKNNRVVREMGICLE